MQDDVLLAYQLSFDLFENDSQAFNFKVIACLSPMSDMTVLTEGCRRLCFTVHMHLGTYDMTLPYWPLCTHTCWACR